MKVTLEAMVAALGQLVGNPSEKRGKPFLVLLGRIVGYDTSAKASRSGLSGLEKGKELTFRCIVWPRLENSQMLVQMSQMAVKRPVKLVRCLVKWAGIHPHCNVARERCG